MMTKKNAQIGGIYLAKVSGSRTKVRITNESQYGGWDGINVITGRQVRIRTAAQLTPIPVSLTACPRCGDLTFIQPGAGCCEACAMPVIAVL